MKKIVTRFVTLGLSLILMMSLFSGCGSSEKTGPVESTAAVQTSGTAAPAEGQNKLEWESDTSPVNLDLFMNYSWFAMDWSDATGKRVTDRTGVTLDISKPVADDDQKLNIMISSGELPSIICLSKDNPSLSRMIDAGLLYSYDELFEKYAPNFKTILRKNMLTNYKSSDGKTYYLTNYVEGEDYKKAALEYNALIGTSQECFSVRKDYLDEIGNPDISTPESFIEALKQMKQKHPDKIGFYAGADNLNSEQMGSSTDTSRLSTIGTQFGVTQYYENNGSIQIGFRNPGFIDAIKFLNKLQANGLLTKESFIDNSDIQLAKVQKGDPISYTWTIGDGTKIPTDNPNTQYVVMKPFPNYKNVQTGTGWIATVITKSAKNPERCLKFLEYLYSQDGIKDTVYGVEGDTFSGDIVNGPHWHMVDGKPTFLPEYYAEKMKDWGGVAAKNGLGEYWFIADPLDYNIMLWDKNDTEMAEYNEIFAKYLEYRPEFDLPTIDPASADGIALKKCLEIYKNEIPKIIFSKDEASAIAEYNNMITKCDEAGLSKVEDIWTKTYQERLKSMGK
ncbi:MAG: ABC-type sugar transport system periplasmic component-like protein [Candidatus Uhrbacteria bacterium GW2011_GWD2_52_7]|uniref:ABC-type sugar transport system periplasmic component-like protein n=1 Tax=Candidatus Uhrbacteria bacterium GW2011_GWD2_52_7 TaxID=1618989 RepID=A0A0G1XF63_9BACT|nr:MAG: ABC-type sugar transport system periplasmic component-like protein [Candidatus Uhrbacteria bacterium GW2011_GWD2_52_7]